MLPGGVDVFRTKRDLFLKGESAPLKKGWTGWALFAGRIAECVAFQQKEQGKTWRISQLVPIHRCRALLRIDAFPPPVSFSSEITASSPG